MHRKSKPAILLAAIIILAILSAPAASWAQFSDPSSPAAAASSVPESQLIQPADMVRLLHSSGDAHPLVLQVGSRMMYAQAHIPGSAFAGPGSQVSGLQLLAAKVGSARKDKLIVLYCGCCPWGKCPNVGPAYKRLHELGFTNVKVLFITNNFGDDWVAKGYPVEKGQ